ncbi:MULTISPECIES: hypothetical protein [unclassified Nocardioides]|uniref:hypothetical protein n=1 Tax=unclassified Nocardioides TaxID=2615069 RepID=UPI003014EC32
MSWDVVLVDVARPRPRVSELDEALVRPLGPADDLRAWLCEELPGTDWSDPRWGAWSDGEHLFELSIDEDPVTMLMIGVRGGGDPVAVLRRLARARGWSVIDTSTGDWLDLDGRDGDDGGAGWMGFRAFRDHDVTRGS